MEASQGTTRASLIGAALLLICSCAQGPTVRESAPPAPGRSAVSPPAGEPAPHPALLGERPPAPALAMADVTGAPFALQERLGQWVVLHLYPRSDTPDCACDATAFTEHLWRFGSLSTEVVCVTSETPDEAARFVKKYGLTVTLLPDPLCTLAKAVGAFDGSSADPVVRTTFVIDPDGRVAARWDRVTDREHIEDVLSVLESLGMGPSVTEPGPQSETQ